MKKYSKFIGSILALLALVLTLISCNNSAKTSTHTHVWDSGVVTKEATCASKGEKKYTCSCGETKTEEIEINKDNHLWESEIAYESTCSSEGLKVYTCTRCNATKNEKLPIVSDNHIWDKGVVTKEAT